ncbi:MAG TPA: class A beta-lactamase [Pyrinomonadaceae bacterium]|nr:class A beta-lactamase [Pyrinomonadaceae bacterium]
MRGLLLFGFAVAVALTSLGCRGGVIPETEVPTTLPIPVATPLARLKYKRDAELEKQFAEIAKAAGGKVGVAAVVLETGEAAFLNEDGRYPMQSVYKLPIAMAVMEQVRLDKLDLDEKVGVTKEDFVRAGMRSPLRDKNPNGGEFTIRELIRLSLVESDGTASDVLLRLVPPVEVQSYLTQIGIRDIKVVNTEKEIGKDWQTQYENWSTPVAAAELLRWFQVSRTADAAKLDERTDIDEFCLTGYNLIFCDMNRSMTGRKRIKSLALEVKPGLGRPWIADKTGTGGTQNGITGATNDIGIVYMPNGKHLAIAVFVSDSPADEKTREAVIARIAKAAWDKWSKN